MRLLPSLDRRGLLLHLLALLAYIAMLQYGPLSEGTREERVYTSVLSGGLCVLLLCLTRRVAFSLIATAGLFSLLLTSSVLKVTYLTTPLLAPDLIYFVNADTLEVILRYPLLLIASFLGLVMLPLALVGIWRIDRPQLLPDWKPWLRRGVLAAGTLQRCSPTRSSGMIETSPHITAPTLGLARQLSKKDAHSMPTLVQTTRRCAGHRCALYCRALLRRPLPAGAPCKVFRRAGRLCRKSLFECSRL